VVATVLIKPGKVLKVIAKAPDLGVPLGTDPRPVAVELRHGAVRHCFLFGGVKSRYKPDKKLLERNAAPATVCPGGGSPSGAFDSPDPRDGFVLSGPAAARGCAAR
jgi:hypothetical protein